MKIEKISINGKIFRPDSALISASDQGLMYGVNAFETFRVHRKKAFLLNEHFDRLEKSLKVLGIKWDGNREKYFSWIAGLCAGTPDDKDAFIRFVVTAGKKQFWVFDGEYSKPTAVIYLGYIPPFLPITKQAVILQGVKRVNPEYFSATDFRIKSMDYVSARVAKLELKKAGERLEGILLTPDGFVAEGLTSNIIWSKDGRLYTPSLDTGILAGTVRAYLMTGNEISEVLAEEEVLEAADEIFLTSGSGYLSPLSAINGAKKPGAEGPVFRRLYAELIEDINKKSEAV